MFHRGRLEEGLSTEEACGSSRGSSSYVYRTVMLDSLKVCAEKVVVVHDNKKEQILRELEILRKAVRRETKKYQSLRKSITQPEGLSSSISLVKKKQKAGNEEEGKDQDRAMEKKRRSHTRHQTGRSTS